MEYQSQTEHRQWLASQAALPRGFKVGTTQFQFVPEEVHKPAKMTLTLLALDTPTPRFAAAFTRNAFPGAPVRIGRQRLGEPVLGAIIVNNKVSNVCAEGGVETGLRICEAVGSALAIPAEAVLPSSTGVIGWKLPVESMVNAIPAVVQALQGESILPAATGIMTTDLYPKIRRFDLGNGSIVGIAKGAGMIEPNLATMLVYILTDLDVPRNVLRNMLARTIPTTFNAITIDSDQSTSDTVVVLSSGVVPCPDMDAFAEGFRDVCAHLAEDVVRNGEGVKHVMKVTVSGAPTGEVARGTAKSVANSPLFQCALCGNDPNVGRLVCAVGKFLGSSGVAVDVNTCRIVIGGHCVFQHGVFQLSPALEETLAKYLRDAELYQSALPGPDGVFRPTVSWPTHERTVDIDINLAMGTESFTVLGTDRTHEYISENADYRS